MAAVDLHLHSTASDGELGPAALVRAAAAKHLSAIALTDHDTLEGLQEAQAAGETAGVQVVAGCEFSVAAEWGEMHLLGYFLPRDDGELQDFLADQRMKRVARAREMVARLNRAGLSISEEDVFHQAGEAAVGRPHVARALSARGQVPDVAAAFDRYIGFGKPAFVPKELPLVGHVTNLVRRRGGVTAAAHLGQRATRRALIALKDQEVDGVEVIHPAHDERTVAKIRQLAEDLDMLLTGGSDWHGDSPTGRGRADLGSLDVPAAWLDSMAELHRARIGAE